MREISLDDNGSNIWDLEQQDTCERTLVYRGENGRTHILDVIWALIYLTGFNKISTESNIMDSYVILSPLLSKLVVCKRYVTSSSGKQM